MTDKPQVLVGCVHNTGRSQTDDDVEASDVVITIGCGNAWPVFPGKRYLDWTLDDPVGLPVDQVRPIRDQIDQRVREFVDELVGAT